ncbi:site-specific DNA-methyltransferase [Neobacillus vireti]|uniref:site-specific DNA-methyltransferase n=1 Tax=Neobacillus vireti TaxID=220686 RepID=UPI002FFF1AAF
MQENALFWGDTLKVLERLDEGVASLVFLDPPAYSMVWGSKTDGLLEEISEYLPKVFQQIRRVLKEDGLVFFYYIPTSPINFRFILDQVFELQEQPLEIKLKTIGFGNTHSLRSDHQTLLIYSNSGQFNLNKIMRPLTAEEQKLYRLEDKVGRFTTVTLFTPLRLFGNRTFTWKGVTPPERLSWRYSEEKLNQLDQEGMIYSHPLTGNLFLKHYEKDKEVGSDWSDLNMRTPSRERIANYAGQLPLALMERVIKIGSHPDDVILDPFSGSSSTLIAAGNLDRRWIGIESSEEAIKVSQERLNSCGFPFDLFTNDALDSMPIKEFSYKQILKNYTELSALQDEYKRLSDNLGRLRELLELENCSTEDSIQRIEDWVLNINKFHTKIPAEQIKEIEKELIVFFGVHWKYLEPDTKQFIITSEFIYKSMDHEAFKKTLDFSPAVINLTKALEYEIYCKLHQPIEEYCRIHIGTSNLNKWPKTMVLYEKGSLKIRLFTIGFVLHLLFHGWKRNDDSTTIKEIVEEIGIFKKKAAIFQPSEKKILKDELEEIVTFRNTIAHRDYIPINTAEQCRAIIIFEKRLLLNFLEMFDPDYLEERQNRNLD